MNNTNFFPNPAKNRQPVAYTDFYQGRKKWKARLYESKSVLVVRGNLHKILILVLVDHELYRKNNFDLQKEFISYFNIEASLQLNYICPSFSLF